LAPSQAAVDESARQAVLPGATAIAPRLTVPSISLSDAVALTVNNDPTIKLGQQSVAGKAGAVQRERGAFDWTLSLKPSLDYTNSALTPSVRTDENNRRLKLQVVAAAFGSVNRQLLDQINALGPRPPRCPIAFASLDDVAQGIDPLAFKLVGVKGFEDTFFTPAGGTRNVFNQFRQTSACLPLDNVSANGSLLSTLDDPGNSLFRQMFGLATGRNSITELLNGSGLQEGVVTLTQAPHEILDVSQQIAQAASAEALLALQRLGVVPLDEIVETSKLDTRVFRLLRSGMTVGATMHFQNSLDNFKDKSLDGNYGGTGKPSFFRAQATADLTVPLMRGRGLGTTASEQAAKLSLSAENDRLRQTMSEETFRVATAYLGLVGAQQTLRSLEESTTRQDRITQLTQQRIAAGDLAQVEIARAQARAAAVSTSLSQARSSLIGARISLAEAMGVDTETIANAPLAAETFAMTPKPLAPLDELIATAAAQRADLRALGSLRSAARILEEGALVNAKPRIDAFAKGGMGTFYDNLSFFYNPDEVNPIFTLLPLEAPPQPATGAVRFSSPVGFYRAMFTRSWKPIWNVGLTLDVPFRNNRLRGAAVQAEAARQRADVQERDLARTIRENVVSEAESLRREAEAIQLGQATVDASQQTVDGAIARFQTGDQTLIDTLLAEESLTQDRLTLIRLWQTYLSDLVRLRFETGSLVSFTGSTPTPDQMRFDPSEFVIR
jgi:outer membrane protein TolC